MNILFHLPGEMSSGIYVKNGAIPKELFYGSDVLCKFHNVDLDEQRFNSLARFVPNIWKRNGIGLFNLRSATKIVRSDLIIIKDVFSLFISLLAKLVGKRVIYVDSMFEPPKNLITKYIFKKCIVWSYRTISFSRGQNEKWTQLLNLPPDKIESFPFCIDFGFYADLTVPSNLHKNFFIAIGRDTGRDYSSLVNLFGGIESELHLVTLRYLLDEIESVPNNVHLYGSLSYEELSKLYSKCTAHIIPLKKAYCYPSGIRAILESFAFRVPVIATRTPVLEEYFGGYEFFVEPEDLEKFKDVIVRWEELLPTINFEKIYDFAKEKYDYSIYCEKLMSLVDSINKTH